MNKGIYKHYKGKKYELIDIATHSETLEKMVVYKALYGTGEMWVRPLSMWDEKVECNGEYVPRFKYVGSTDEVTIYIEDLADKLEETTECWEQYLNIKTGEVEALSDGTFDEMDVELAEQIDSSDDYIRLPNQYEIHEYNIMEEFADKMKDSRERNQLFEALNGRKPFRHFKDVLNYLGLNEAYYAFRHLAFMKIMRDWCQNNEIIYKTHSEN